MPAGGDCSDDSDDSEPSLLLVVAVLFFLDFLFLFSAPEDVLVGDTKVVLFWRSDNELMLFSSGDCRFLRTRLELALSDAKELSIFFVLRSFFFAEGEWSILDDESENFDSKALFLSRGFDDVVLLESFLC